MAESHIIQKLSQKLLTVPQSEEDVIYVLSKIRKLIELNDKEGRFEKLLFYCNFAFHPKIDRKLPESVISSIKGVWSGGEYSNSILGFSDFQSELRKFIKEYNLPDFYIKSAPQERMNFLNALTETYSDTPIVVILDQRYEVVITKAELGIMNLSFKPIKD